MEPNILVNNINILGDIQQAGQNPHLAGFAGQQRFELQRMAVQAQEEGANRVKEALNDHFEEMRRDYEALANRCRQLEERIVTLENNHAAECGALKNNLAAQSDLIRELMQSSKVTQEQLSKIQKDLTEHYHPTTICCQHSGYNCSSTPWRTQGPKF